MSVVLGSVARRGRCARQAKGFAEARSGQGPEAPLARADAGSRAVGRRLSLLPRPCRWLAPCLSADCLGGAGQDAQAEAWGGLGADSSSNRSHGLPLRPADAALPRGSGRENRACGSAPAVFVAAYAAPLTPPLASIA